MQTRLASILFSPEWIINLQIAWDDARRLAKRRIEREKGRNDAAEDLSELSEGEKEKGDTNITEAPVKEISRINSEMRLWSEDDNKTRHLYIVLIRYVRNKLSKPSH